MSIQNTINAIWAQGTVNKQIFTESDINLGIAYKGPVVSNQLNGIGYALYQMLDFVQRSGGYYNNSKVYNPNDIVCILRKTDSSPLQIEYYVCLDVDVVAKPPIKNAIIDDRYAVDIYDGGMLDGSSWARVSGNSDGDTRIVRDNDTEEFDEAKKIQFLIPNEVNSLEFNQQMNGGTLKISVYFESEVTTFDLTVKQKFVKTDSGIKKFNNRFNQPVPELEIRNVYSTCKDYGAVNNYHDMMPYGIRFEVGSVVKQEGGNDYYIFIQVRDGLQKIVCEGYCNGFNVSLSNEYIDTLVTNHLIIPIKENGGALCYETLGSMIDFDYEPSVEFAYKKGLYVLKENQETQLDTTLFAMLYKEQGSANIPPMAGMFRRNYGTIRTDASSLQYRQHQESGVPNIVGTFVAYRQILSSGAFYHSSNSSEGVGSSVSTTRIFTLDASRVSDKYKNSYDEVTPDNFCVRYCYRAF